MRRKSQEPAKTVADLSLEEEKFIAGASADEAEKTGAALQEPPEISVKQPVKQPAAPPSEPEEAPAAPSKTAAAPLAPPAAPGIAPETSVYALVRRTPWPITFTPTRPILAEGSPTLDRPFIMRLKEDLWNSIDEHCAALGVPKSKWVREHMERALHEEQQYFLEREKAKGEGR